MRALLNAILLIAILFGVSTSHAGFLDRILSFRKAHPAPAPVTRASVMAAGPKCSELFERNVRPDLVFPYESRVLRMKDGADLFLSEGYSAHVFLSLDPVDKKTVVIKKVYKQNAFGTNRFHYDMEGLKALMADQAVTAEDAESAPFEIARGERYMEPALTIDDLPQPAARLRFVEGRTVHALVLDPTVSEETKRIVAENYALKLAELQTRLEKSGDLKTPIAVRAEEARYFFDGQAGPTMMLKTESKMGGEILIKSDNVVVDPYNLNKMTIVDPY